MEGYKDAEYYLKKFETAAPPAEAMKEFQHSFEKLVVLDYIIRNTGEDFMSFHYCFGIKCVNMIKKMSEIFISAISLTVTGGRPLSTCLLNSVEYLIVTHNQQKLHSELNFFQIEVTTIG